MQLATLDNPVIKDADLEALSQAAADYDAGRDVKLPDPPSEKPDTAAEKPDVTEDKKGEAEGEKPPTDKPERKRDAKGQFLKDDGTVDPDQTEKPADQQQSEYAKKQAEKKAKEQARLDRSWQALDAEKERVRAQAAEMQRQSQQGQQQQRQQPARTHSSQQMAEAAAEFQSRAEKALAEGDEETAKQNKGFAQKAWAQAQQLRGLEIQERQQAARGQFEAVWNGHMQQAFSADPELGKPESELSKQTMEILGEHGGIFSMIPDGFKKAVELAHLRLRASRTDTAEAELAKLKEQLNAANKKLGISGANPTSAPKQKRLEDMTTAEMMAYAEQAAAAVDKA